jgi:dUTP pyrophosphatase
MNIKFKKKDEHSKLPIKGSLHAAASDAYAHTITTREDGKIVVGLGFSTEIPAGFKGIIVPRSNLTKYNWMLNNSFGVIDSDYRGEWMAVFTPILSTIDDGEFLEKVINPIFPYTIGDRVCQIFFDIVLDVEIEETDELSDTDRGEGGFGSTGIK